MKTAPKLRCGFTTGAAAAAATKGALQMILEKQARTDVAIKLLTGDWIQIPLHTCELLNPQTARCAVIKDAGDDPDITHKAEIGALVEIGAQSDYVKASPPIVISGGQGVGTVTKPGLDIPPGEPAINPMPRRMITQAIMDVLRQHGIHTAVSTQIFVTDGEQLAQKTLNARLGIIGGLSILGTTGVVRPLSHDAYTATIQAALGVSRAAGVRTVVLTTGRRSERFAQLEFTALPEEAFVQIGDFFKMALETAAEFEFKQVILAVFFGKAVKMALGVAHTHAAKSSMTLARLARWALDATGDPALTRRIETANTARHALDFIWPNYPAVVERVGANLVRSAAAFAGSEVRVRAVIFGFDGQILFYSEKHELHG